MEDRRQAAIIYDGECPFCSSFVRLQRLRGQVGEVELIDARLPHPLVDEAWRRGFDLNQGMIFLWQGRIYYGADAVTALALLTRSGGKFHKLICQAFGHPGVSRVLYPLMRTGRSITLRLLGRARLPEGPAN